MPTFRLDDYDWLLNHPKPVCNSMDLSPLYWQQVIFSVFFRTLACLVTKQKNKTLLLLVARQKWRKGMKENSGI